MTLISDELYKVINSFSSLKPIGEFYQFYYIYLIDPHLFQSLKKSCGGEYTNIDPNNTECLKFFQAYQTVGKIRNQHNILISPIREAWYYPLVRGLRFE